jgi:hypothetical protein
MHVNDLFESPISSFDTIGDFDKNSSFRSPIDRKILTTPKAVEKITRKWSNTPVDFNMYFVNSPEAGRHHEVGEVTPAWLQSNMPKAAKEIKIKQGAINVIFTNNKGAERVPMTAWVIAHRLCHALYRGSGGGNGTGHVGSEIVDIRDQIIMTSSTILKNYGIQTADSHRKLYRETGFTNTTNTYNSPKNLRDFYHAIGTMKSARDANIRNELEFVMELFAQYIITGKITFNKLPRSFNVGKPAWGKYQQVYYRGTPMDFDIDEGSLETLAEVLTDMFENLLHMCVGRIFVM